MDLRLVKGQFLHFSPVVQTEVHQMFGCSCEKARQQQKKKLTDPLTLCSGSLWAAVFVLFVCVFQSCWCDCEMVRAMVADNGQLS